MINSQRRPSRPKCKDPEPGYMSTIPEGFVNLTPTIIQCTARSLVIVSPADFGFTVQRLVRTVQPPETQRYHQSE